MGCLGSPRATSVTEQEAVSVLDGIIAVGFLGLIGYLFYLGIWRLVSPKHWAPQCEECGGYVDHKRGCSRLPATCPRCGRLAGDHKSFCRYTPLSHRIAAVAVAIALILLRVVLALLLD
jgi:hypothetical protein